MEPRRCTALILLWMILILSEFDVKQDRFSVSKAFLVYRTVSITQKACTCSMTFSCSCCQSVVILYTKAEKNLCVNFTYQRNGLNIDVSLDSATIKAQTTTNYKSFRFCVHVPYCLFSTACINVLELNQFPRSITACLRLEIFSKKQLWQMNYDCISISTQLPTMSNLTTQISMTNMTGTKAMENPPEMPSTKSTMSNNGMTSTPMMMPMETTSMATTTMSTKTPQMMMPMATTMMSVETTQVTMKAPMTMGSTQMTMNVPMTMGSTQNTMMNTASVASTPTGSTTAAAPENVTKATNMLEI